MITWWTRLSWSHATLIVLLVALLVLCLIEFARLPRQNRRVVVPRRDYSAWERDYAARRQRMIDWLGDRYLLAKPINRKLNRADELPYVLKTDLRSAR